MVYLGEGTARKRRKGNPSSRHGMASGDAEPARMDCSDDDFEEPRTSAKKSKKSKKKGKQSKGKTSRSGASAKAKSKRKKNMTFRTGLFAEAVGRKALSKRGQRQQAREERRAKRAARQAALGTMVSPDEESEPSANQAKKSSPPTRSLADAPELKVMYGALFVHLRSRNSLFIFVRHITLTNWSSDTWRRVLD
jgi:hypothetical protein